MTGRMRKFGAGMRDGSGYAAGVRLGNAKSAKWLARKSGGRCMTADADDLGEAEGGKARQHLGRPGRKHGGSVKRKGMFGGGLLGDDIKAPDPSAGQLQGSQSQSVSKPIDMSHEERFTPDAANPGKYIDKRYGSPDANGKYNDTGDRGGQWRKNGGRAYAKGGFLKGIKKGALRAEMGVKSGDKIPAKKLDKATHSSNPLLKKRAVLAKNMKSWKH